MTAAVHDALALGVAAFAAAASAELPLRDFSDDIWRQTVVAAGTPTVYEGHPTTLLAEDGRTMFCMWTQDHGGTCSRLARSDDAGLHWTRVDALLPNSYVASNRNCPTLQKITGPDGRLRYVAFSCKLLPEKDETGRVRTRMERCAGLGILMSEDAGKTWREIPGNPNISAMMPPTGFMRLKDGTSAIFGQVRADSRVKTDGANDDQEIWMSVSRDGGFTWGAPRVVASKKNRNLCEPCCLRSPDGKSLVLLMRDNRHTGPSAMSFSDDEGATWSEPRDTPAALTGDRHEGVMLPDGRYFVAFRNQRIGDPLRGQYMAWVGTWDDLVDGREGQCRVRMLNHHGKPGRWPGNEIDTGYSGVELLPDGTVVCTTYSLVADDGCYSSVVSMRFNVNELPAPAARDHAAAMELFQDRKLGLMMHFGLYSEMGIIESWPLSDKDAHWSRREMERELAGDGFKAWYFGLNRSFNPVRFNPERWAKAAVDGGFKYVVFTTKHHDGFCLFDTKETNYKTTDPSCPFAGNGNADIVKVLFDACRARGLGVTAYFSKADWHHDDFWENAGVGRTTDRNPSYDVAKNPAKWARFKAFNKRQMLELVRDYGPLDALWLDGGWLGPQNGTSLDIPEAIAEARKIQPGLLAIDRGAKDHACEDVATPEQTVPDAPLDRPWESCITMADNWGYHYDDQYKSADEIVKLLVDVVAKGGNLALNVGPMPDGRLPRPALERMAELGRWLRRHGEAIYATRVRAPYKRDNWAFTQSKDGKRTFAIRLWHRREATCPQTYFPDDSHYGKVTRVVHLATKREIPFERVDNPALGQHGVMLHFPADFVNDPHADAFEFAFGK